MTGMLVGYDPVKDKSYRSTRLGGDIVAFLAWCELGGMSPRTLDSYERVLARAALMYPGKRVDEVEDVDAIHIAKQFKPAERRVRVAALRSFYKWARQMRKVQSNPFDALPEIRRTPQPVIRVFTEPEIEALLSLPVVDAAPMAVLLEAGLRKAEARQLRVAECQPETGQVIVLHGKGSKQRIVPMTPRLAHLLNELVMLERLGAKDHVFYSVRANRVARRVERSRPVGEGTFARWWRRCLGDAGVKYRHPHVARHTFATRWRRLGLAIDELQILLGHSSSRTTSDLYVHTNVQDVAERMARILSGATE